MCDEATRAHEAWLAAERRIEELEVAVRDCQTLTPSLMTGDDAIDRLKQINSYVYKVLGQ
jgi:hypothetical protein